MSFQPFRGEQMVIIERRNERGELVFDAPQPPPHEPMPFDDVYTLLFFRDNPEPAEGSSENLNAWLKSKGWAIRAAPWATPRKAVRR